MSKTIVFVIGEMGSGKSYQASKFAKYNPKYTHIEGDDALTWYNKILGFLCKNSAWYCKYVSVEHFVKNVFVPWIEKKLELYDHIIVSQALYFRDHRKILSDYFSKYKVKFIFINTPVEQLDDQLLKRSHGKYWRWYGRQNRKYFELPINSEAYVYNNNAEEKEKEKAQEEEVKSLL